MAGDELVTILGVELSATAMANIRKFKSGIDSVASQLKTLGLVATGMAAAAGIVINRAVDEAAAMQTLSDKTGVSTDSLQEWSYAAGQVGVDAKAVQGDLVSLTKSMSSPIPGQFNVNLAMIGVSARAANGSLKDSSQVLEDIGERMAGMSAQRAMQWGSKIGVSDDTVLLLRQGKEGLAKLRAEAQSLGAIIPSEAIKRAAEFKAQINSFQAVLKSLTSQIAIATVPALSRVVDLFKGWIAENRRWIMMHTESFMTGLVSAFERVWGAVKKVLEVFQPFIDKFKSITSGISQADMYTHLLTGAMAGLLLILAPILGKLALLGAGVVLVSAALEDLFGYLNGEDSATGYILDKIAAKFPGIAKGVKTLKNVAEELFGGVLSNGTQALRALGQAVADVFKAFLGYVNEAWGRTSEFVDNFTTRFPALTEAISLLAGALKTILGGALDVVVTAIELLFKVASKVFGWLFTALEKAAAGLNLVLEKAGFGGEEKGDKEPRVFRSAREVREERLAGRSKKRYVESPKYDTDKRDVLDRDNTIESVVDKRVKLTRPELADATKYGDTPDKVTPSTDTMRAGQDFATRGTTRLPGGLAAPTITDNRTVIQHINTSDPVQAGNIAAQRAGGSYTQLTSPGLNAPVVR